MQGSFKEFRSLSNFVQYCVLTYRIKNRILPPVPKPVIPEFTIYQPENQVNLTVLLFT